MHLSSLKLVKRPLPIAILAMLSIWSLSTEKAYSDSTTQDWIPPVVNGVTVNPTGTLKSGMTVNIRCDLIGKNKETIDDNSPKGQFISGQSWWLPVAVLVNGHYIATPNKEPGLAKIDDTWITDPTSYTLPKYGDPVHGKAITITCIYDYGDPMHYFYSSKSVTVPVIPTPMPQKLVQPLILPHFNGSNNTRSSSTRNKSAPTPQAPIMQPNSRRVEPMQR